MKKEDNLELMDLSVRAFGKKYAYKKLMQKGIILGTDKESGVVRRMPLTHEQAKDYLIKRMDIIENLRKDLEAKDDKSGE